MLGGVFCLQTTPLICIRKEIWYSREADRILPAHTTITFCQIDWIKCKNLIKKIYIHRESAQAVFTVHLRRYCFIYSDGGSRKWWVEAVKLLPARTDCSCGGDGGADFDEAESLLRGDERNPISAPLFSFAFVCFYFVSVYKSCSLNLHLAPSRSQTTINLKASPHPRRHFLSRSREKKNANTRRWRKCRSGRIFNLLPTFTHQNQIITVRVRRRSFSLFPAGWTRFNLSLLVGASACVQLWIMNSVYTAREPWRKGNSSACVSRLLLFWQQSSTYNFRELAVKAYNLVEKMEISKVAKFAPLFAGKFRNSLLYCFNL